MDTITPSEQDNLEEQLAKALYASGAPLSLVENPYWSDFYRQLRPAFKLPSCTQYPVAVLETVFADSSGSSTKRKPKSQETNMVSRCFPWSSWHTAETWHQRALLGQYSSDSGGQQNVWLRCSGSFWSVFLNIVLVSMRLMVKVESRSHAAQQLFYLTHYTQLLNQFVKINIMSYVLFSLLLSISTCW